MLELYSSSGEAAPHVQHVGCRPRGTVRFPGQLVSDAQNTGSECGTLVLHAADKDRPPGGYPWSPPLVLYGEVIKAKASGVKYLHYFFKRGVQA